MSTPPDRKRDVEEFLLGDPSHVSSVQQAVRATVRSFRLGNADVEGDLVQEALSRTLASLTEGRFQGEASLETYARNVARYTCLEHFRRRRHEVAFDPELHPADGRWSAPEASYLSHEEYRRNLEAFTSLPPECREILRMICLDGSSYREIAARLGITEATLKSRVHRCRLTCREAAKNGRRPTRLTLGRAWP